MFIDIVYAPFWSWFPGLRDASEAREIFRYAW